MTIFTMSLDWHVDLLTWIFFFFCSFFFLTSQKKMTIEFSVFDSILYLFGRYKNKKWTLNHLIFLFCIFICVCVWVRLSVKWFSIDVQIILGIDQCPSSQLDDYASSLESHGTRFSLMKWLYECVCFVVSFINLKKYWPALGTDSKLLVHQKHFNYSNPQSALSHKQMLVQR